jgi:hypothetical protein
MVERFWVSRAVLAPVRADAVDASHPACPPPMTMTSYSCVEDICSVWGVGDCEGVARSSVENGFVLERRYDGNDAACLVEIVMIRSGSILCVLVLVLVVLLYCVDTSAGDVKVKAIVVE